MFRSRARALLLVLLVLAVQPALLAQQSRLEGIDAFVESVMEEWKVPGLAVAAIHDGEVVLMEGYGYRDVDGKLPVTKNTLFAIGSNTKSFTVSVLGILNDEGQLEWDTPLRDYLPDFRLHDPEASSGMTPRDLVRHNSGLPRHDWLWYATGLSRAEIYSRLRYLEPSKPFRSTFQYNNLMFMTAGVLAERITGRSWEENVNELILTPLDMSRSNFSVDDMQEHEDFAYPYFEVDDEVVRIPFRNIDEIGPAGSINSSVAEMIRYVQFHLDLGSHGDARLLSEANARQMQSPQMVVPIPERIPDGNEIGHYSYGLGLGVSTYRGRKHVGHGGGIDGFISAMDWLPEERIGVVVLTNFSGNNPVPRLVARRIFDGLIELEPVDWAARTRKRAEEARKQREEAREKLAEERHQDTSPTHALEDYASDYEHPAYGIATVRVDGDALECDVVGLTVPLEHYHYDIFVVPHDLPPPLGGFGGKRITFSYDKKGEIDGVAIPLESRVDDIVFTRRKPDDDEHAGSTSRLR